MLRRAVSRWSIVIVPFLCLMAACQRGENVPTAAGPTSDWAAAPLAQPTASPSSTWPEPPTGATPTAVPGLGEWSRGASAPAARLVVYCDFQSTGCAALAPVLSTLLSLHPQELLVTYRPYPLIPVHDKASLAGQAAQAAGEQGRFWEMHDLLYGRWLEWASLSPEDFQAWLLEAAEEIGLEGPSFRQALESGRHAELMQQAFDQTVADGIPGTPVLYLNGQLFQIGPSLENLEAGIRLAILGSRQYQEFPPLLIEPDVVYVAHLELGTGEVVVELFADVAPLAVNSFVFLARQGWYDGAPFFRVVPDVLAETGDPSGTGLGGPGYAFGTETDPSLSFDQPGMVALSSAGPGVCGSQFFISLGAIPALNGSRTIFGRVTQGLGLLQELGPRDPLPDLLVPAEAQILGLRIEER